MKGTASHLLEFLEGARKRFIIPVYQRNYDWKIDNCKQLFDDLVNLIKQEKNTHFFGSIVSYAHGREEVVLIDGQQRITTVSLILIAMINAMKKGVLVPSEPNLCEIIENTYIIDKYRPEERKVRLKPFRDDCDAFDKLIYKDESEYRKDSKVTINYNYFYDRIVNYHELTADELFRAIDSLEIIDIEIELEHGDNPQLIFESLNSTGLDLTEADKIRNYVLMGLTPVVQEKYYDNYWNKIEKCCNEELDSFVRNYLTIMTGIIPNIKMVYSAFKEYSKDKDMEMLLADMLRYAVAYDKLTSFNLGSDEANEIAKRLDLLDMTVAYPFFMAFIVYAQENDVPNEEMEKVLSCIETYIFRRLMCGLPTNALNKIFRNLHSTVLKSKNENNRYSDIMVYYLESRKLSSAFPKDEEFIQGFVTKNVYSMRGKNKEYIFERLENGSSKEKNDVVKNIEDGILTIEHIMPQTLSPSWKQALGEDYERIQEQWLHTISNLTLTGYNSNYSNRPFEDKKNMENGFCDSGIRLNRFIAQCSKWTEEELQERREVLSKLALKIWAYPVTDFTPEQREEDTVSLSEDNGAAVGRKLSAFVFQGTQYNVLDWADMMWEMINNLYHINPSILYQEAANPKQCWFEKSQVSKHFKKLAESLYFSPSGNSTWNKMAILKNLFRLYQLDEDDLYFVLQPLKEDGGSQNDGNRTWLIPSNENQFRFQDWLATHDSIYWHPKVKMNKGDTVYFYSTIPTAAVIARGLVEETDIYEYDDSEEVSYRAKPQYDINGKSTKIVQLEEIDDYKKLTYEKLQEHGLNGRVQSGRTISGELLDFIEQGFE